MQNLSQEALVHAYQTFTDPFKSVILGTVSAAGQPQASYAPFVKDEVGNLYVFVSGLSAHTQNLTAIGKVSALFVEDEAQTPQIFARKRLSYDCTATLIARDSEHWRSLVQQFEDRFGNIIEVMKGLADFRIFQLQPQSGRFVLGFGAAYDVDPNDLSQLIHRGA